jgi:hypothetical protein
MVIVRRHGVHLSRGFATGLFLLIPWLERKQAPGARREEANTSRPSTRQPSDQFTFRTIQWREVLPRSHVRSPTKAVPSASRSPGRPPEISGGTSRAKQQARRNRRARMYFICELMRILPRRGKRYFSMRIQSCHRLRLFTRTRQLFNDRTSAHSRKGFRALRSHYARSSVDSMPGPLCALPAIASVTAR